MSVSPPPIRSDADELDHLRGLVPSVRELDLGGVPDYKFVDPPPQSPARIPIGATLRNILHALDYREITAHGPTLPLFLFGYFSLIQALDTQATFLLFPEIATSFGVGVGLLFFGNTALGVLTTIGSPFVGYIADRRRRVTMLAVGTFVSHASIALRGTTSTVPPYLAYQAAGAVGGALGAPVAFPLITDYYPVHTRTRVFAFFAMGGALAGIIAPVTAGLIAVYLGWQKTFIVLGTLATIFSMAFFLLKEPVRGVQDRIAAGLDAETARHIKQRPVSWGESWRAASKIKTLKRIWIVSGPTTAVGVVLPIMTGLWYVQHYHLDVLQRGIIASVISVPVFFGLAFSGVISDRILADRPGRILTLMSTLQVFGMVGTLVLFFTDYLWLAVIFSVIPAFVSATVSPALNTVTTMVVPSRMRGIGVQTTAPFALVGLLMVQPAFALSAAYGIHTTVLILLAVQVFAAIVMGTSAGSVDHDIRNAMAASVADDEARQSRAAGENKMLICRKLEVGYEGAQVLFGVDFDVTEGEFVALLGTNGAGKSTMLRAICGVQEASGGAIFLDGDDITHAPPHEIAMRGVVIMPGGHAVFPSLTVDENIRAAARMHRADPRFIRERREEMLNRFPRLRERLNVRAGDLSGGEQQMVALSQALLMRPRLLMIDELSLGLAPNVVEMLLEALRDIHRQGTTIIIVEQSINVALQVAERAVYMEKGSIRFDGTVAELRSRPDVIRSIFLSNAVASTSLSTSRERTAGPAGERETVLSASNMRVSFGGLEVLAGVDIAADRGEIIGIVGPNGAGKSTLFDALAGFVHLDAGEITLLGTDVTRHSPDARARRGLARSYQNVRLFPALSVRENIAVALERHLTSRNAVSSGLWLPMARRSERRASRRVDNLIETFGLGVFADKFVSELSTGTRRIVDIACLLATRPRVLLLDEPSSGLAQAETEQLGPFIGRIVKETGCALLMIEHDLGLVSSVSDRMIAMRLGAVMAEGTPSSVLENQEVVDVLLGGASEAVLSRSLKLAPAGS